ncbi:hypothetical protein T492DRAFT_847242 [Pavlovales sp. CCMP2436]|nr:hypothetical protein T492DRAFT_847242 [Pavlovales sp. CCMP2436]
MGEAEEGAWDSVLSRTAVLAPSGLSLAESGWLNEVWNAALDEQNLLIRKNEESGFNMAAGYVRASEIGTVDEFPLLLSFVIAFQLAFISRTMAERRALRAPEREELPIRKKMAEELGNREALELD